MRVVIVGGAGFIGTALATSARREGMRPLVLDTPDRLRNAQAALDGIETAGFDFTRDRHAAELFEGAQAVVHLACTTNPARSMETMAWDAETNIGPSLHLFDAAVRAGVERLVFSSSGGTVYGAPNLLPVPEDAPTVPRSAYGVSKLAIESYLGLYSQLRGISLRVANPYGAFQLAGATVGVLAKAISSLRAGEEMEIWGDGSVVRDYVSIEDVVSAFLAAIVTPGLASGAYNVGSGAGVSVNEILAAVFEVTGQRVPVRYLEGRPYDVPAIFLDCTRFAQATGWRPRKSLNEGIADLWRAACERAPVQHDAS